MRAADVLEHLTGGLRAAGAYKGVDVFESGGQSELLAQSDDQFPGLPIAI